MTIAQLHRAGVLAVATLVKALKCRSATVRVSAARALLEFEMRGREMVDIEDRISELEKRFADEGGT